MKGTTALLPSSDIKVPIWYIGLKFSEITKIVKLRNFILLALSDNDEPMLMRQKM